MVFSRKQINYNIVFIKPPSEPNLTTAVHPQTEVKTLLYVLVERPEEPASSVQPIVPSKPEVHFIQYN